MSKFFDSLAEKAENPRAGKADKSLDNVEFIDTGSYALNALLSGSIYGGIATGKITAFAGEESTGKTFFALEVVKNFLDKHPDGAVFYFESEEALTKDIIEKRGIDSKRLYPLPAPTVQSFRSQALRILNSYLEEETKKPMLFVLDSMGNLSTDKELTDIAEGSDKRDMTRAQLLRGTFRALTIKLGEAKVPMIVTNHVYSVIGAYIPTKEMGGGAGLKYAASTVVFFSKSYNKEKDDNDKKRATGAIIRAKTDKSRFTQEQKQVRTLLNFGKGLDRYFGLLEIAEVAGIVKKVSTKYEFPNGKSGFESVIESNPETWFTPEVLTQIDEAAGKIFKYGGEQNDLLSAE